MTASQIDARLSELNAIIAQEVQIKQMISDKQQEISAAEEERSCCTAASMLLKMALKEKIMVKEHIEGINTGLFKAVFGNAYDYVLEVRTDPTGMVNGLIPQIRYMGLPMRQGGGATNMAGVGNRAGLVFADPTAPPIMIFDEPATNLDNSRWELFKEVLAELSEATGTQLFLISHSGFSFEQSFQVSKTGVASKIVERKENTR